MRASEHAREEAFWSVIDDGPTEDEKEAARHLDLYATPRSFGRNDMNSRNYLWLPLIILGLALTFTGAALTPTLNGLGVWGFLIAAAGLAGASREDPFR